MDLSKLTTPKINYLREVLNLTEDEEVIFNMLAKGKSIAQIASATNMSTRTVDSRIARLKRKFRQIDSLDESEVRMCRIR